MGSFLGHRTCPMGLQSRCSGIWWSRACCHRCSKRNWGSRCRDLGNRMERRYPRGQRRRVWGWCGGKPPRHCIYLVSLSVFFWPSRFFFVAAGWFAYAEILELAPQHAQSVAVSAMLATLLATLVPMFDRSPRSPVTLLTVWSVMFRMQDTCALRADSVFWSTLPRSQEQRPGASSGAGQKGIGSMAPGQIAKYCCTKS